MNSQTVTKKETARETAPAPATQERFLQPPVDIFETKDGYILEAELPGVSKRGLEVLLEGNELTLIGRKEPSQNSGMLLLRESAPQNFRRSFVLDPAIDTSKISARLEQGLLRLELPKAEKVKPKKITIS